MQLVYVNFLIYASLDGGGKKQDLLAYGLCLRSLAFGFFLFPVQYIFSEILEKKFFDNPYVCKALSYVFWEEDRTYLWWGLHFFTAPLAITLRVIVDGKPGVARPIVTLIAYSLISLWLFFVFRTEGKRQYFFSEILGEKLFDNPYVSKAFSYVFWEEDITYIWWRLLFAALAILPPVLSVGGSMLYYSLGK